MSQACIVQSLRTAGGRRKGALEGVQLADHGAAVLDALVEQSGIDPVTIDDVIMGCVIQAGERHRADENDAPGLRRTGGQYDLQTMCEGRSMANVTIVEAL